MTQDRRMHARRQSDLVALRLRAFLDTALGVTRVVAVAPDRESLLRDATEALVAHGAFILAWVGADLDGDGWVERLSVAGVESAYTDGLRVSVHDVPEGRGPTGTAIRTGRPFVCEDVASDERMAPWRSRLLTRGLRASAAFPLRSRSLPTAALTVYADVVGAFGDDEAAVLGDLAGAIGFAIDAHATAEARAVTEERYTTLVREVDAVVFVRDLATGESWASAQAEAILGYTPEEAAAPGFWRTLVVEEDRQRAYAIWDADEDLESYELDYRMRRADGQVIWVEERWRSIRDRDGRVIRWLGVTTDVTARRRLEETVARTQRLEAVGRLAAATAHDFRNVLQTIQVYQGLLDASIPADDPRHADIAEIGLAIDRGAALTRQLLSFGRERPATAPDPTDVAALLRGLEPVLARVSGPGVRLTVDASVEGVATIRRDDLERAILNLVINARDAMPSGGALRVSLGHERLGVAAADGLGVRPGRYLVVAVADTGTGMTPAMVERALEPFFTTKEHGTGIGLPSVYGTARQAGGAVRIESEPGVGTTVQVLLPRTGA